MWGETVPSTGEVRRIFLSVAGPDERWGSWLDHVLRDAGYEVDFYRRSFPLGANFVDQIDAALTRADRMIAVVSPAYLDRSSWVREEWQAGMRLAHTRDGFLLPVLVEQCELPPLLGTINMIVLLGLDRAMAVQTVLRGLVEPATGRPAPEHEPPFPGYEIAAPAPRLALPAAGPAPPAVLAGRPTVLGPAGPDDPDRTVLAATRAELPSGTADEPFPRLSAAALTRPGPALPGPRGDATAPAQISFEPGPVRPEPLSTPTAIETSPGPARVAPATATRTASPPQAAADGGAERTSITLLHLPAFAAPTRPGHAPDTGPEPFGAALLDDLDTLAGNPGLSPDLIVVTGVALEGRRGEYEQAAVRLAALTERLSLPVDRIALVPGRGDVSAAAARAYFAACEDEEIEPTTPYWRKWRHFVDFHANLYRDLGERTFAVGQEWTLYPMADLRLVIAGLNSTMAMSHRQADDRGEVGQAQANWFADRLAGYERAGWFRLAVGHHPPLAADRVHSAKATDAYGVDLILGSHVNLLVAAHGHGAPTPDGPLPAVPTRLPRSGTTLISAHPPHPVPTADAALRYQVLRLRRSEVTRLDRRFSRRAGAWRPAEEVGPAGIVTYRTRWEHAATTFPRPTRRAPAMAGPGSAARAAAFAGDGSGPAGERRADNPDAQDGPGARRGETFADRVAEIAELSSPGATVTRISPTGVAPEYLRVTVPHGPVFEQRPVGIAEDGVDESAVDRFVEHVHHQYAATDPQLTSDLVYGGPLPAPDTLVRHASVRGVRLRSFVEYQGLLDLRGYLRRQSDRLAADRLYPPALYLPQRFRVIDGGPVTADRTDATPAPSAPVYTTPADVAAADVTPGGTRPDGGATGDGAAEGRDLLGQLVDWLTADSARFVLILGDFGRGKTFCLHELARTLPERRPHLIPLLIDLRAMEKAHSVDELVAAHLVASGEQRVDVSVFRYMLRRGRLVLLFDGFDELALRVTYETAAEHLGRLLDAVEGQAKVVVTSRTQHFLSHGQVRGALGARVELLPASRIAEVGDFTERQIEQFLVRLHHGDAAKARERLELIHDVRDLLGLSHNPRMLGFIASLDTNRLRAVQARTGMISSADLYGELIEEWLRYEERRARPPGAGPALTAGERREAVTALALRLWRTTDQVINLSELTATTSTALDAMTDRVDAGQLDSSQAAHMVGSGSLLVRADDGGFTFIHQSVMEYLVAAAAARGLAGVATTAQGPAGASPTGSGADLDAQPVGPGPGDLVDSGVLVARVMSPLMVDFLRGVAGDAAVTAWASQALADPESGQAARANALAIARRADPTAARGARLGGAHLEGADLTGLDLTGADLTGANLTDADLDDCDLTGANLTGARLAGVRARRLRLTGANLTNAELGRARLTDPDLTDTVLTGSRWERAALLGATPADRARTVPELAAAAVPGRDPVEIVVDSGVRWTQALSPAHDLIAYGTGHHVALEDLSDGHVLAMLRGRGEWIRSVAFSWDGSRLAAGDVAGGIQIWNVGAAEEVASFVGHASRVRALAFSPDGLLLATGCFEGHVHVWDLTTLTKVATLHRSTDRIKALRFSPDGTLLAYGDEVRLWDVRTRTDLATLGLPNEHARTMCFSPDGTLLAWVNGENTTRVWNLAAGREVGRRRGDQHARALAFDASGSQVAIGSDDGTIRVWDLLTGGLRTTLRAPSGWVTILEFAGADSDTLIAGCADGTVEVWKVTDGAPPGRTLLAGRTTDVLATAFVPEQPLVVAASESGSLRIWDTRTAAQVHGGSGERAWCYAMSLTDDASLLATAADDGLVRIYELAAGRACDARTNLDTPVRRLDTRRSPARAVAFSPDTTVLAVGHPDGTVGLWNPWSGRPNATLKAGGLRVLTVAFAPDGERLAAGTDAGTVHIWDLDAMRGTSGTLSAPSARRLAGHTDWVQAVAFSPDSELLASASGSGTIRIWDAATGALRHRLVGHGGRVRTVAFAPDGRLLASGGEDGIVRLWDPVTGGQLGRLAGHTEEIRSVAFAASGDVLVSGSADGTTRLWTVADGGAPLATMLGLSGGRWTALFPDGSYKTSEDRDTDAARAVWWSIRLCRFDPDELTPYLPQIRRRPLDAPLSTPPD